MLEETDGVVVAQEDDGGRGPHFECVHDGAAGKLCLLPTQVMFLTQVCTWQCRYADITQLLPSTRALAITHDSTVQRLALANPLPLFHAMQQRWVASDAFHRSTIVRKGVGRVKGGVLGSWTGRWLELNALALVVLAAPREGKEAQVLEVLSMNHVFGASFEEREEAKAFEVTVVSSHRHFVFRVDTRSEASMWCERLRQLMGRPWALEHVTFPTLAFGTTLPSLHRHILHVDLADRTVLVWSPFALSPEAVPFASLVSVERHGHAVSVGVGATNAGREGFVLTLHLGLEEEATLVEKTIHHILSPPFPAPLTQALTPLKRAMVHTLEHRQWFSRRAELRLPAHLLLFESHSAPRPVGVWLVQGAGLVCVEVLGKPALCLCSGGVGKSVVIGFRDDEERAEWSTLMSSKWHHPVLSSASSPLPPFEDRRTPTHLRAMKCSPNFPVYSVSKLTPTPPAPSPVVVPIAPMAGLSVNFEEHEYRGARGLEGEIEAAARAVVWGDAGSDGVPKSPVLWGQPEQGDGEEYLREEGEPRAGEEEPRMEDVWSLSDSGDSAGEVQSVTTGSHNVGHRECTLWFDGGCIGFRPRPWNP